MGSVIDSRNLRQERYRSRARRARLLGWALVPVASVTMSAALWSDPVLQPKLLAGLEVVKPIVSSMIESGSSPDIDPGQQGEGFVAAAEFNAGMSGLPASKTPINRPEVDG
ncbi:MAG: hypothetical protein R8G34_18550 [Paracoccaceae bacterium]|nr:hypothetical protein [Paracoccaceae bacterium]